MDNRIDIKENKIQELDKGLLKILLMDRSSGRNIIWATDNYQERGEGYFSYEEITLSAITGYNGNVIKPRTQKSKQEQLHRVKDKAEVFTPSWICNKQNNLIDNSWFGRENVFNVEDGKTWHATEGKIEFPEGKTWQDYVKSNRLEITCGEAPYLASRYDTTTGEWINVQERIGLLDRKIRIVSENTQNEKEWVEWVFEAYKSTYGYEWQGDSLLIARENLLYTFGDYYEDRFAVPPIKEYYIELAEILSWNLWQMDGLKFVIPNSCKPIPKCQPDFFNEVYEVKQNTEILKECEGCLSGNNREHTGIYCKIMDWEKKKSITFISLIGRKI